MIHVISKGARPRWRGAVRPKAPEGHFPEDLHIARSSYARGDPGGARWSFWETARFDGDGAAGHADKAGWSYACHTARSTVATWEGHDLPPRIPWGRVGNRDPQPLQGSSLPVTPMAGGWCWCWAKGYQEPLSLVSNMDDGRGGVPHDQTRFRIETFFSTRKARFPICISRYIRSAAASRDY